MVTRNRAVFFDRDGTLIKTFVSKKNIPIAIKYLKDFKLLKNVKTVVNKLSKKYLIIVITNQPDVSTGKNKKNNVTKINLKLKNLLKIDQIYTCYSDKDNNFMRKPNPGMIYKAKKKYNIKLKKSFVVGDREKDILAGKRAKCKTILIHKNYNKNNLSKPDFLIKNLIEIFKIIKV